MEILHKLFFAFLHWFLINGIIAIPGLPLLAVIMDDELLGWADIKVGPISLGCLIPVVLEVLLFVGCIIAGEIKGVYWG